MFVILTPMRLSINPTQDNVTFSAEEPKSYADLNRIIATHTWSPATFKDDRRNRKNFLGADMVGLDFDEGLSLEAAKDLFKSYRHVIGTTRSHQTEKNGVVSDRFRVVLFLEHTCTDYKDYEATIRALLKKFPQADPAAKDASRQFFPCKEVVSCVEEGLLVPIEKYVEPKKLEVLPELTKGNLGKSTLEFLAMGAPRGERNQRLYKAARDFYQNGYTVEEFKSHATHAFSLLDHTQEKWNQTIESAFSKDPEYPPNLSPETEKALNFISTPKSIVGDTFHYLKNKDLVQGVSTGFPRLDKLMGGGLREGELIGLVAQAGAGKSSLFHKIQLNLLSKGLPVGYLSQEMDPATEVLPNYLSIIFQENTFLEDITASKEDKYAEAVNSLPVYFTKERGHLPYGVLREWIKFLAQERGVKYFFLDHFAYCQEAVEDFKEASQLIRNLKLITSELRVNLFAIVQPKTLQIGQTLGMDSMRGGAALNQACDLIFTMERNKRVDEDNVNVIKCVKARHKLARLGEMNIKYDPTTTDIKEVTIEEVVQKDEDSCPKSLIKDF